MEDRVIDYTPFEVGDEVIGLAIADLTEEISREVVYRKEKIKSIVDEGDGYLKVTTDFTESKADEIIKNNASEEDEQNHVETSWFILKDDPAIKVVRDLSKIDLSEYDLKYNATIDAIETPNADIPMYMFNALKPFVNALTDKFVVEAFDVDDEISVTIAGISFTPSMLNTIINKGK